MEEDEEKKINKKRRREYTRKRIGEVNFKDEALRKTERREC